jgi:hypothetical protein
MALNISNLHHSSIPFFYFEKDTMFAINNDAIHVLPDVVYKSAAVPDPGQMNETMINI